MHVVKIRMPVHPTASAAFGADVFPPISGPLDVADGVGNYSVAVTSVARRAKREQLSLDVLVAFVTEAAVAVVFNGVTTPQTTLTSLVISHLYHLALRMGRLLDAQR
jgi:hypothetical protein